MKLILTAILTFTLITLSFSQAAEDAATDSEDASSSEQSRLWRLRGGGEIFGQLVKETTDLVYVDIGPRIVEFPADAIVEAMTMDEAASDPETSIGQASAVFDEETGSVIFRPGAAGPDRSLSRQEVLEEVKRGVVLVSNPGGLGTGWLINQQGDLITNHHVTGNETYQTVTIFVKDGDQWRRERIENCTVEAFSSMMDIALVRLNMDEVEERGLELYPLTIAETGELEAGDTVFAVGNPGMGAMVLEHTISEGIVSSLARNFNDVIYTQTTAAVNPGNSGGPLVNDSGRVVGLITLKAMFQEGVAFALPVSYIYHFLRHQRSYAIDDLNRNKGFRYHRPN